MEQADDEIEAVCSFYDGVHVEKSEKERKVLHKIRSLEDAETSASVLLDLRIPEGYPAVPPRVILSNPRGIGETEFKELCRLVDDLIAENEEMPMISAIFQFCSQFLDENQYKNMVCSICLTDLSDSPISVTPCEHSMHSFCYCRYLKECLHTIRVELDDAQPHLKAQVDTSVACPVCREILSEKKDFEAEIWKMIGEAKEKQRILPKKKRRASSTKKDADLAIKRWREKQHYLSPIFAKQKEKGGIIDVEEERKRSQFFIETNVNSESSPSESTEEILVAIDTVNMG
ncbi:unnamed protein product [Caenorhabditis sp. 36 PRJEB53466]|nr:unnamed protein product [Caenorhabditis sp. 36 PRJEB53466]